MIEPMAGPPSANDSLKLIGFYPYDFIHTLVTERGKESKYANSVVPKWWLMVGDAQEEKTYPQRLRHSLPNSIAL